MCGGIGRRNTACKKLLGANPNHIITYKGELNMCDYCKNREDEENKFIDESMQIYGKELIAFCECRNEIVVEIAYCPMCGREL